MMFCLVDDPNRDAVESHHFKFGMHSEWITQVKMTASHGSTEQVTK